MLNGEINMRKSWFILLSFIFLSFILVYSNTSAAAKPVVVIINGEKHTFESPIIKNDRLLLPMRWVFETLNADVQWDNAARTVTAQRANDNVVLPINSPTATVNGKTIHLDTPAIIISNYTLVPIRFISESLGANVQWEGHSRTVTIELGYPEFPKDTLTPDEKKLANLINDYRESKGLKRLPISKSLTEVARTHVKDSNLHSPENGKDKRGIACNGHSWSDNGNWTPVCYTSDHLYAELAWSKPRELTVYQGNGYEISYWHSRKATPQIALNAWKNSPGHNAVLIGEQNWSSLNVMGVAIYGNYSHVWFGREDDPAGYFELN